MELKGTCATCNRQFVLSQIGPDSDAPGRCPFCGAHLARHYSTILVDGVRSAERAAYDLAASLGRILDVATGFTVDVEGLVAGLVEEVRLHGRQPSR